MEVPQVSIHVMVCSLGVKQQTPRLLHVCDSEYPVVWAVLQKHEAVCKENGRAN